uniref:NAD-dependent epimerase/dehydratase domain-containing protein n=1 Tax=Attheya septentrionalis TaxID=420275 RepID=A0A6T7EV96_9STRA|mmetsp:Transcript_12008/g.21822  ORF Transcript_12008/g.21822 Transcript_12008/m.21822 type:complete len:354 (+) Transcript_12008:225-1286(+)
MNILGSGTSTLSTSALVATAVLLFLHSSLGLVTTAPRRLMILGLGNVGKAVADEAARQNYFDKIYGTVRRLPGDDAATTTPNTAVESILFQDELDVTASLKDCTHVLITIPPPMEFNNDLLYDVYASVLKQKTGDCWVGFVSTTGVYGAHQNAWVDEESECLIDANSKTHRYLRAETIWQSCGSINCNAVVFRCAGLYGWDRSALHTLRKNGKLAIDLKENPTINPTSRIHEVDVARIIVSCMMKTCEPSSSKSQIYNLADNDPERRDVVMRYASELLDEAHAWPAYSNGESAVAQPASTSERSRRRGQASSGKRVANEKITRDFESLLYPTYREGLQAILQRNIDNWTQTNQ